MQHTSLKLGLGLVVFAVGCASMDSPQEPIAQIDPPAGKLLPSASMTPRDSRVAAIACGDDVAWNADTTPDIRYGYSFDSQGRITHAEGVYAAGGTDDSIDYSYDAASNWTGLVESNGQYSYDIAATYDGANNLVDYLQTDAGSDYSDGWDYAFSGFGAANQPAREDITETGQASFGYALAYDASGRLVTATPDQGAPTTWTYDDAALTITVDTDSGAFHGVITYDASFDELSEVWGGSDPSAIASSYVYNWAGTDLVSATFSSGTTAAPATLSLLETDTLRYDCANARKGTTRLVTARAHAASHR